MTTLISAQNVSKSFGKIHAVRGASFSVSQGEVLGFLGPNGAGKTTTMRLLTGYLSPDVGHIKINDIEILRYPIEAQRNIGYLPEGGPLYEDMQVTSILAFAAKIRKLNSVETKNRIEFVVDALHLRSVFYQTIETLSKGYKRRVALAIALLHDPKVLILDEPTDGLDPNQKQEVQQLIMGLMQDKAIVISTHILEEIEKLSKRAVIINKGQIVASGTIPELISQASNLDQHVSTLTEAFRTITKQGN